MKHQNLRQDFRRYAQFRKDPFGFFDDHRPRDTRRPVLVQLGLRELYLSYDPTHAQHVLQDQKQKYLKSSLVLRKIKALSGPGGLIQLKDQDARPVRQASAELMGAQSLDVLLTKVSDFVDELFPLIDESIERGRPFDLAPHLTKIVLRTAGTFILNHDVAGESGELNSAFIDLNRRAGEGLRKSVECPFSIARRRSLNLIHSELDRVLRTVAGQKEPCLFSALQKRFKQKSFLRDQVKAFMFAGYDTTASSLIYAMYLVASHAPAQTAVAAEARLHRCITSESLRRSTYLQSVYKEALRLYPSAYFLPRETAEADVLGGMSLPKGSQLFMSVRHIQRHPDYFDEPEQFQPDRFLKPLKHPFSFLPFGGGPRVCIGATLAKFEATLVIRMLCERYEMRAAEPRPPSIEALITAHTKDPLPVYFSRRTSSPPMQEDL